MEHVDLLHVVTAALEEIGVRYFVTGSAASMLYGEPRFTNDVDIVVDLSLRKVSELCASFPESDFYVSADAASDAVQRGGMFNIIHPASGLKADLIVAGKDAFDQQRFARARRISTDESHQPFIASAEDVILHKMRFFREGQSDKHLRDIAGILKVSGDQLDRAYIELWAREFDVLDLWQAIVQRVEG